MLTRRATTTTISAYDERPGHYVRNFAPHITVEISNEIPARAHWRWNAMQHWTISFHMSQALLARDPAAGPLLPLT